MCHREHRNNSRFYCDDVGLFWLVQLIATIPFLYDIVMWFFQYLKRWLPFHTACPSSFVLLHRTYVLVGQANHRQLG